MWFQRGRHEHKLIFDVSTYVLMFLMAMILESTPSNREIDNTRRNLGKNTNRTILSVWFQKICVWNSTRWWWKEKKGDAGVICVCDVSKRWRCQTRVIHDRDYTLPHFKKKLEKAKEKVSSQWKISKIRMHGCIKTTWEKATGWRGRNEKAN